MYSFSARKNNLTQPVQSFKTRQDESSSVIDSSLQSPLLPLVLFSLLGFQIGKLMIAIEQPRNKLENDDMCGITTGGQEECYFDCDIFKSKPYGIDNQIITNIDCLKDCFPHGHCVQSLIKDVENFGLCYSILDIYNKTSNCTLEEFDFYDYEDYEDYVEYVLYGYNIIKGTCSNLTEHLLRQASCLYSVFEQPVFVRNTIRRIIIRSCSAEIREIYVDFNQQVSGLSKNISTRNVAQTRLAPTQTIAEFPDATVQTILEYSNTRHRYPWVCSLRSKGTTPQHLCAVNLLSVPPKPTVIVGAAHCTYLCKNSENFPIPSCCCSDGPANCADDKNTCGDSPQVFLMTGADVEVLCGEWETGAAPSDLSGENYNVILGINDIIRHPNFNTENGSGPIDGNDIAVFKVDDSNLQNNKARSLRIWPACLPPQKKTAKTGLHTGWSRPPPFHIVETYAHGYVKSYRDFYKQWHYKMDLMDKCQDSQVNNANGEPLMFPSNTSYPAGTVCAKDFTRQTCFTNGDSGSPLMVYEEERRRLNIEGVLSFVKGCDRFQFGALDDDQTKWILDMQSDSPNVYTKLSCFLPWIAEQYNMEFQTEGISEEVCLQGVGDKNDGENEPCRPLGSRKECIFPFYYNGVLYNECVSINIYVGVDFVYLPRCPIRNITTKIDGINSFTSVDSIFYGLGYCLMEEPEGQLDTLDPSLQKCKTYLRRRPLFQCNINCPGVIAFGTVGGGAVLAGIATTSVLGSLPTLAGVGTLGLLGLGGSFMIAQIMCAGPLYCNALSGKCCLVVLSSNGLVCPDTC